MTRDRRDAGATLEELNEVDPAHRGDNYYWKVRKRALLEDKDLWEKAEMEPSAVWRVKRFCQYYEATYGRAFIVEEDLDQDS